MIGEIFQLKHSLDTMSNNRIRISEEDISGPSSGRILVMKDKSVLDESDGDEDVVEMEDLDIAEKERHERNKRKAKHGAKYNPLDEDSME